MQYVTDIEIHCDILFNHKKRKMKQEWTRHARFVPFRMGLIWRGTTWPDPGLGCCAKTTKTWRESKKRSVSFLVFDYDTLSSAPGPSIRDGAESVVCVCMAGPLTRTVFNLIFVTPFPNYSGGWTRAQTAGSCVCVCMYVKGQRLLYDKSTWRRFGQPQDVY